MSKLVYGWGINDVGGSYNEIYYNKWRSMIQRIKSKAYLIKRPTYKECSICEEWKYLSNFKEWFEQAKYINGYVLDKDLYIPNNKLYSTNKCLFIPQNINNLILNKTGKGYSKAKNGNYKVEIKMFGNNKSLGTYTTEKEAHNVYIQAKANHFMNVADEWWHKDEKIATGLYRNAEALLGNDWRKSLD